MATAEIEQSTPPADWIATRLFALREQLAAARIREALAATDAARYERAIALLEGRAA